MTTVRINIPDDLRAIADEEVASGRFADYSEYVANLIRGDRERRRLENILRERIAAGPATEMTDADFDRIRDLTCWRF